MHEVIPEFDTFAAAPIFMKLGAISQFAMRAEIPKVSWRDDKVAARAIDRLYDQLRGVLKAAGFFYDNELRPIRRPNEIGVEYADDRYAFSVRCDDDTISINREGSTLRTFHDWYTALMPSSHGLMMDFVTIISEECQRKIDVVRGQFQFRFILSDLAAENTGRAVKNATVMAKLLKGYPDDNGIITDSAAMLNAVGRSDFGATRFVGVEGRRRLFAFKAEAPANLTWSTLWLSFSYIGESYTSPDGAMREAFDAEAFLGEYVPAYVSFLRDAAINGFVEGLLRGYSFKSVSGQPL